MTNIDSDSYDKTCIDREMRSARYFVILQCNWKDGKDNNPTGREAARLWVRSCAYILSKYCLTKLKHAPDCIAEEKGDHVDARGLASLTHIAGHDLGFSSTLADRLGRLKGKYDPYNFFSQNANIVPILS